MPKNTIVVLSDIHISTDDRTNWYQKIIHEPFLSEILDFVIQKADTIQELVLLGDIFDFWTYPPNQRPPEFADIIRTNPNIFGVNGKLSQALTALSGQVTYVNGNHDINITENDLHLIQNPSNYKIKYCPDPIYIVRTASGKKIAFTHGHHFTIFNAPDKETKIAPIPIGCFITRSAAYMFDKKLKPGENVADLPNQGNPNGLSLSQWLYVILKSIETQNLVDVVLGLVQKETQIPDNEPIILNDGRKMTIAEARKLYENLHSRWIRKWGFIAAEKAILADLNGTYIAWFAQRSALMSGADMIVLGHTHEPKLGIKNGFVEYANCGFECPSLPDMSGEDMSSKAFTFTMIDTDQYLATIYQVVRRNNSYQIRQYNDPKQDSVISDNSIDYSCYIIIDNTQGKSQLHLVDYKAEHGNYIVNPPDMVPPGETRKFWLQDHPGIVGVEGSAKYKVGNTSTYHNLTYSCPTVGFNHASGTDLYTSIDGVNWGDRNRIKTFGHPFFVRFVF